MSDYIQNMRKIIGHETLICCGASVILLDRDNRMLLQRRKDDNLWGHHGGAVEIGERVEEAARRELYEETGLKALDLELFKIFSGPEYLKTYPNGDRVYVVDIVYICREFEGEICLQDSEVAELSFFHLDELPDAISPASIGPLLEFRVAFLK